jgi:nucleotide-binding universal stress UspA family protein
MYKKILVPLDGTKQAEKILPHVEHLARDYGAKVVLLHALRSPDMVDFEDVEMDLYSQKLRKLKNQAESYLAALQEELQEKGINAKTCVVNGSVIKSITKYAQQEEVDHIVLTSHRRSALAITVSLIKTI